MDPRWSRLLAHVERVGHPSLVLAWLHRDEFGPRIAVTLAAGGDSCDFFQVRGSMAADTATSPESLVATTTFPQGLRFRQIILGFHVDGDGSRWLRDSEISSGVIAAIDEPKGTTIVGAVSPWSAHP
ncbi:MAG: hypothetical protein WB784_01410 [Rhodanobacteraceae bacterium]